MQVALVGLELRGVENHSLRALREALRLVGVQSSKIRFHGFPDLRSASHAILKAQPNVVGISLQTIEASLATMVLVGMLRDGGYAGRIVLGGHFATLNAQELLELEPRLDAVVRLRARRRSSRSREACSIRLSALARRGLSQAGRDVRSRDGGFPRRSGQLAASTR